MFIKKNCDIFQLPLLQYIRSLILNFKLFYPTYIILLTSIEKRPKKIKTETGQNK